MEGYPLDPCPLPPPPRPDPTRPDPTPARRHPTRLEQHGDGALHGQPRQELGGVGNDRRHPLHGRARVLCARVCVRVANVPRCCAPVLCPGVARRVVARAGFVRSGPGRNNNTTPRPRQSTWLRHGSLREGHSCPHLRSFLPCLPLQSPHCRILFLLLPPSASPSSPLPPPCLP